MSIGAKIKQLRLSKKLTQEELAANLGITSKAVSQWECDRTSPDVSQIPALCNLFQISADELLNINLQKFEEEKQSIIRRTLELLRTARLKECWQLLQEGIAKYPNDYSVMKWLPVCGARMQNLSDITKKEKASISRQCVEYCKRILDGCTDDFARHIAVEHLCLYYAGNGETDKAEELAMKMPSMSSGRELLLFNIYKGSKENEAAQILMIVLLTLFIRNLGLNYKLESGELLYSEDELHALNEKKIAIVELLFENGDYGYNSGGLSHFYELSARKYASEGSTEKALSYLEKSVCLAIEFVKNLQKDTFTHTSLYFKGMTTLSKNVMLGSEDNQAKQILQNMERKEYDTVRDSDIFKSLSKELEPYINIKV
ncbi:MAG: helix-turn-helix transcriptional regulator [Clostridia bacterium]|nr:helix-turn-helix transcriptional regulator [Clostridia bacterium]